MEVACGDKDVGVVGRSYERIEETGKLYRHFVCQTVVIGE